MHSKLALPSDLPEDPDRLFVMTMAPFLHIALILIVALVLLVPSRFQKFGLLMPFQGCSLYGGPEPEVIALEVDFDGRYMWDGALLANRAALTRRLAGVAAQPIQAEGKRDASTVIDIRKQTAQRFMLPAAASGAERSTVAVQRRG